MTHPLTVLIVGGYGTFGGRLARLLSDVERLTLLIGGRSVERAQQFCSAESGSPPRLGAQLRAVYFDRDTDIQSQLRALAPEIVVDASGPFQSYGARPYRLVEACIESGVHYLDLADSAEFVCGIASFNERARARGVFVLSGVSSFPVLTAAVARLLSADMARVDMITGGIAPSPFANVGLNVIRAIAGYAGKPVRLRGRVAHAFTDTMRYTIAAPGHLPLHSIEFSLVDVPDLQLLAQLWPECRSVWIGAGPVPAIWHRLLRGLAWLVRMRLLRSLSALSSTMYWAINRFSWGEHRGGMFVRVSGIGAKSNRIVRSWHLVAEGESGPLIPSMAAEAIIRKYAREMLASVDGDLAPRGSGAEVAILPVAGARAHALRTLSLPGARPAVRELEVSDYEPLLARHSISFGVRDDSPDALLGMPLYQHILGASWHALPESLRHMHSVRVTATAAGRANVTRGKGWLASLIGSVVGFPHAGTDIPVEVRFAVARTQHGYRETWTRRFANRSFRSEQFAGNGRFDRLVCERFGPLTLALALVFEDSRLHLVVRGWSFLGIPLPRALAPTCDAHESEHDGRFHFDVAISHRWTGLIVHYRGWLV